MQLLEVSNLNYRVHRKTVLQRVNLELGSGKIAALVGANGAGKTTLMRVIAGQAKGYQGVVRVDGESSEAARKSRVALTDDLSAFGEFTRIREIKEFYSQVFADFDESQFDALLEFLDLNEEAKLNSLSKGMRAKLVIALAFARRCRLYLLDEPFDGIDAMSRKRILKSLLIWKPEEATVLISDHVLKGLAPILDELVLVKNCSVLDQQKSEAIRAMGKSIEEWYEDFYQDEQARG